jgi:methylated-DNA-[protein]-cysteine S-methyltransferase
MSKNKGGNMARQYTAYYSSEIGSLEIIGTPDGITSVCFVDDEVIPDVDIPECLQLCVMQIDEYFHKTRREFSIPLQIEGTDFEKQVWNILLEIPYGTTRTYMDIAKAIGNPKAVRAVGLANGKNPIPLIIPCHRVIGSNGRLTGYGGGIWRKKWLLQHEGAYLL